MNREHPLVPFQQWNYEFYFPGQLANRPKSYLSGKTPIHIFVVNVSAYNNEGGNGLSGILKNIERLTHAIRDVWWGLYPPGKVCLMLLFNKVDLLRKLRSESAYEVAKRYILDRVSILEEKHGRFAYIGFLSATKDENIAQVLKEAISKNLVRISWSEYFPVHRRRCAVYSTYTPDEDRIQGLEA